METIENTRDLNTDPMTPEEKRLLGSARCFLGGINPAPGLKISIMRIGPTWIPGGTGWIETIDYTDSNDFSLESLKEAHGGGSYVLKVLDSSGRYLASQSVKIAGDPKKNGKVITEQAAYLAAQPPLAAPQTANSDFSELVKILIANTSAQQQNAFAMLSQMMQEKRAETGSPNTLKDISDLVGFIDQIRVPAAAPADDGGNLASMIGILGQFLQKTPAAAPAAAQPAAAPVLMAQRPPKFFGSPAVLQNPAPPVQMPSAAKPAAQQAAPSTITIGPAEFHGNDDEQQAEANDDGGEDISLADEIAEMEPEEIADLIKELVPKLGEQKVLFLAKAFQEFGQ